MDKLLTAQEAVELAEKGQTLERVLQEIKNLAIHGEQSLITFIPDDEVFNKLEELGYEVERRDDARKDLCTIFWFRHPRQHK